MTHCVVLRLPSNPKLVNINSLRSSIFVCPNAPLRTSFKKQTSPSIVCRAHVSPILLTTSMCQALIGFVDNIELGRSLRKSLDQRRRRRADVYDGGLEMS